MKFWLRLAGSLAISAAILALVFREADRPVQEVAAGLGAFGAAGWGMYAGAQLLQGWVRSVRYRILLGGSGTASLPGAWRMFGVTLARNMFVDMLPARTGELAYWALLNRGEGVRHEDCATSMVVSVWLDFLALAIVLALVLAVPALEAGGKLALLAGLAVVGLAVIAGWLALFRGVDGLARTVRRLPAGWFRRRGVSGAADFLDRLAAAFAQVRKAGVLGKAIGFSIAIRVVKYAGLAAAFYGMGRVLRPALADLPVWQVLTGLIGAEAGAALPVPAFLSLGPYEAAGSGALHLAGVAGADAAIVMLGTHVASQIVDYALGGLGLLGLLWSRRPAGLAVRNTRSGKANPILLAWICLTALAVIFGLGFLWRASQQAGAKEAPGAGTVMAMGLHEMAALDAVWGDLEGFIVWSSTMYGQHELVRMDWPSGHLTRLTKNPYVDTTPKISPDGRQVLFARSRQEWVSFRNLDEWDIWVLDLKTEQERRVAEHGAEPGWTGDGKGAVFHRGGREVIQVDLATGAATVLLGAREGRVWTGPSLDPRGGRLAVTVRGSSRSTSLFALPLGTETPVAGGCQLAFVPGGDHLVLVEKGGQMENRICRLDREGKNLETLLDVPGFWSHEYFPRISNDGRLLVFGAAREGHEHDTADYEIFLWRIGDPWDRVARVSFHTGNDQWPDVWVNPPR